MNLDPIYPGNVAAGFEEYPDIDALIASVREQTDRLVTIRATDLAVQAGKAVAANAVMIGAVGAMEGIPLDRDVLKETLLDVVPQKARDINDKAFELGYETMMESRR